LDKMKRRSAIERGTVANSTTVAYNRGAISKKWTSPRQT